MRNDDFGHVLHHVCGDLPPAYPDSTQILIKEKAVFQKTAFSHGPPSSRTKYITTQGERIEIKTLAAKIVHGSLLHLNPAPLTRYSFFSFFKRSAIIFETCGWP
jgi:hypothetical protein